MDPCPRCNKSSFTSTSGRTLHIKGCKAEAKPQTEQKFSPEYEAIRNRTPNVLPVLVTLPVTNVRSQIIARFRNVEDAKLFVAAAKNPQYQIDAAT